MQISALKPSRTLVRRVPSDGSATSYPSMVSRQQEPDESKYFLIHKFTLLLILTIAVSDGKSNLSAPAAIQYHGSEKSFNRYPDAQPAPAPTQKDTPERKRKDTPPTTSTETTLVTKRIKVEGSGSRGRIRQADFDELTRSVIEETISIYRAQIGSVEPFPERADDRDTVKQAWLEVCTSRNVRVELEEDIFKLVSDVTYLLHFVAIIYSYRLLDVLHKQEGSQSLPLGHILCLRTTLTALDQNARFVTMWNIYWKDIALFIR